MNFDSETDESIVDKIANGIVEVYNLEKYLTNFERCVKIRRFYYEKILGVVLDGNLKFKEYDYIRVYKNCCENVIGYVSIPVGLAGPVTLNGLPYYVPLATTEGCLVASTNRGAKCTAINGIIGVVVDDGMTRAPVIRTDSVKTSLQLKLWVEEPSNFQLIKNTFDSTSRFAKLSSIFVKISGVFVYLRFKSTTGEAMGMNMVSLGVQACIDFIKAECGVEIDVLSLSGNFCSDKKPTAINWINGRGKSVICEAVIPHHILKSRLNVAASRLVEVNTSKNLVGSAVAGTIGGNNANAANIVSAIFAATGQDLAQVVESSHCLTYMETRNDGNDLYISCSMPCLEVGTIGGGTALLSQSSNINLLNLSRDGNFSVSANLALVICATVLCSELSLMASLTTGSLISSHLVYNRSKEKILTNGN